MNKTTKLLLLVFAMLLIAALAVCSAEEAATRQAGLSTNESVQWAKNAEADAENAPVVKMLENGVKVQKTPYNTAASDTTQGAYDKKLVKSWNNIYLNADNRGCTACHTIEDALEMMETYHGIIYIGYETEQGIQNCFGCHSFYGDTKLRDSIHTVHQTSDLFNTMGGSCESCHYIQYDENGNARFQRWDYVKYDVLRGIADLAADTVETEFAWNQTEITDHEDMYFKSIKADPATWVNDDSQLSQDVYDAWTIKFTGDIDNPCEMTLNELIEKYADKMETKVLKSHCCVNGPGQAMIYQAEVTGIPIAAIMEDLGVHEDANMFYPIGADGYCYNVYTQTMVDDEGMLIVKMNGDTLYADQGWPVAFWCKYMSAGNFTKQVVELSWAQSDGGSWDFYGDFTDCTTGRPFDKPNVAVLNATDGQIFAASEKIHLEGYADAWNEPIVKLEFSFDHGVTWQEYPIEDATAVNWVYWTMDLNNITDPGAYLMRIRATSLQADGSLRVNDELTNFMFNVQ